MGRPANSVVDQPFQIGQRGGDGLVLRLGAQPAGRLREQLLQPSRVRGGREAEGVVLISDDTQG